MRFDEVRRVLEYYGWRMARAKGSHRVFVKQGCPERVTIAEEHRRVKRSYLSDIIRLLGIEEVRDEEHR